MPASGATGGLYATGADVSIQSTILAYSSSCNLYLEADVTATVIGTDLYNPEGGANHTLSSIDATLSTLDDVELWLEARTTLNAEAQSRLDSFLEGHGAGTLTEEEEADLQSLLGSYGRLTVRKAHAWLLLGRRGYRVPPQEPDQE